MRDNPLVLSREKNSRRIHSIVRTVGSFSKVLWHLCDKTFNYLVKYLENGPLYSTIIN